MVFYVLMFRYETTHSLTYKQKHLKCSKSSNEQNKLERIAAVKAREQFTNACTYK